MSYSSPSTFLLTTSSAWLHSSRSTPTKWNEPLLKSTVSYGTSSLDFSSSSSTSYDFSCPSISFTSIASISSDATRVVDFILVVLTSTSNVGFHIHIHSHSHIHIHNGFYLWLDHPYVIDETLMVFQMKERTPRKWSESMTYRKKMPTKNMAHIEEPEEQSYPSSGIMRLNLLHNYSLERWCASATRHQNELGMIFVCRNLLHIAWRCKIHETTFILVGSYWLAPWLSINH